MHYEHRCVIDKNGYYKTFVRIPIGVDDTASGNTDSYVLQDDEQLLDTVPPTSLDFARARWNGHKWIEDMQEEEAYAIIMERRKELA